MNCQPLPTDTPGIFRCPVCGLQNPRPIKKPFIAQCGEQEKARARLAPLIARLAEETKHPEIVDSPQVYHQSVFQWAAEGFPVRDEEDYKYIVNVLCPGCRHYRATTCTCGTCGGKGQLAAIKAWMETESCPAMRW